MFDKKWLIFWYCNMKTLYNICADVWSANNVDWHSTPHLTSQTLTHPEGEETWDIPFTSPSTVNTNLEPEYRACLYKHNSLDNFLNDCWTKLYPLFSLVWSFLTFKLNSAEVLRPLKIIIFPRRPPIIKFEGDFIKIWLIHVSFAEICQTNKLNNINKYLIDV